MSDAYTELVERVRAEHAAIDAEIDSLRRQRGEINDSIKDLTARKADVARMLMATQPRRKRTVRIDGSE